MNDERPLDGADEIEDPLDPEIAARLDALDDDEAEQRAASLRAGLADYDLDEEDIGLLEAAAEGPDGITYLPALPVLAIVGRPKIGRAHV